MVRIRRTQLGAAALVSTALLLAACSSNGSATNTEAESPSAPSTAAASRAAAESPSAAADGEGIIVGVPALLGTHPFYIQQNEYFQAEADRLGVELRIVDSAPDGNINETRMLDDAYAMVESGVDALIFEYINAEPWLKFAEEAAAKGVCLINESQTPLTGASSNWGEDNHDGGFLVGVSAGEWAKAQGISDPKLAVIVRPDNPPVQLRTEGFIQGVQSVVPGAKVVAKAQAIANEETAAAFANMAAAQPEANIWFAPEIDSAVAGLAALKEAGMTDPAKVYVAATNVSPDGLEVLGAGDTPLQVTYMYSKNNLASVQMFRDAVACAQGNTIPPTMTMKGKAVDGGNLADVQAMLAAIGAPGPLSSEIEDAIASVMEASDTPTMTPAS